MVSPAARIISGSGTSENAWRSWLSTIPQCTIQTLLGPCRRIVVVSPHPDDEILGCGGMLALAKNSGVPAFILSVTDGEKCYPDHSDPEHMRAIRRSELCEASSLLGILVDQISFFGLPDGDLKNHAGALLDRLLVELQAGDVVFAPWRWDGHPDHEACFQSASEVSAKVGARLVEYPVWGWHWAMPEDGRWRGTLARRLALPPEISDRKKDAIARFTSQIVDPRPNSADPVLTADTLLRFKRDFEVFFT